MVTVTSAQLFIKQPQFVVETTEGTTPTSSPAFTSCGSCTSIEIRKNNEVIPIGQVGQEDPMDIATGPYRYTMTIRIQFLNTTFAKRFVNAANFATPTGTISEPVSIVWSQYLNGPTENYFFAKGARPKRITMELGGPGPITATAEVECMNITKQVTAHGLTTPTFATNPTGAVLVHTSSATPVKWNSITLNAKSISLTFERGTAAENVLGSNNPLGTTPHSREITGTFTNLFTGTEATTLETDYDANTSRTLLWTLDDVGPKTLTVTAAEITDYTRSEAADTTAATVENIAIRAVSAVMT